MQSELGITVVDHGGHKNVLSRDVTGCVFHFRKITLATVWGTNKSPM